MVSLILVAKATLIKNRSFFRNGSLKIIEKLTKEGGGVIVHWSWTQ